MNLDDYLSYIDSPESCDGIPLSDISKLKTIMDRINKIPLINNDDYDRSQKFMLKQKESKINYFEEISTIYDDFVVQVDAFKDSFLGIEEAIINNYNNLSEFNSKELIDQLIQVFLPMQHCYLLSRSTNFKVWGFDNAKTDFFFPNLLFETIQNFHLEQEKDFDLLIWDSNMHRNVEKYVKLKTGEIKTCSISFIVPQNKKMTETHVCFIFEVHESKLEFLKTFFSSSQFFNFTKQLFSTMFELCWYQRENQLDKRIYKSLTNQCIRNVGIYALELIGFMIEEYDSLTNTIMTAKEVDRLENDYKITKIPDFDLHLIFDKDSELDNNKLADLKNSINRCLSSFVSFFEMKIKNATRLEIKSDSDYIFTLNKEQNVVKFEYETMIWDEYFDHEKPFKNNQKLRYFISDDDLYNKLKERCSFETQKLLKKENLQFHFENLIVDVFPLFVLGDNKSENEIFGIKISKKDMSQLMGMAFQITIPGPEPKNNLEEPASPIHDKRLKSIVKSGQMKAEGIKRVSFLKKQISSIGDGIDNKLDTELESVDKNDTTIQHHNNFNKLLLQKGNLEQMYSSIRGKLEIKLKEMKDDENAETVITQAFNTIPIENLRGTIVGEYVNEKILDISNNNHVYYEDNSIDRSVMVNNYFNSKNKKIPLSTGGTVNLHEEKSFEFELIDGEAIDRYEVDFLGKNKAFLYNSVFTMFNRSGVIDYFKIDLTTLYNLLEKTNQLYDQNNNSYHNFVHGITVMSGCYYFLKQTPLISYFDDLGVAAFLFAGLMHDIDHKGNNNDFEMKKCSELAITYNNKSILENHHSATTFRLLQQEENNIFQGLSRDDYMMFRSLVIEMILMTDLKNGVYNLNQFKNAIDKFKDKTEFNQSESFNNFQLMTGNLMHCADIYSPAKSIAESDKWTNLILEEFDTQLKKERENNLPVTQFFIDNQKEKSKVMNQVAFISSIVKPLWVVCDQFLEGKLNKELMNIETNLENWNKRLKEIEDKEDKEN